MKAEGAASTAMGRGRQSTALCGRQVPLLKDTSTDRDKWQQPIKVYKRRGKDASNDQTLIWHTLENGLLIIEDFSIPLCMLCLLN